MNNLFFLSFFTFLSQQTDAVFLKRRGRRRYLRIVITIIAAGTGIAPFPGIPAFSAGIIVSAAFFNGWYQDTVAGKDDVLTAGNNI